MSGDRPLTSVVDDDASVRRSLARLIRCLGFAVESFASAEEFLRSGRPDETSCLILDLCLPGMDGLALQSELQRRGCAVPILFITGQDDPKLRERAIAGGAVDFLTKPFQDVDLLSGVERAIARDGHVRDQNRNRRP